MDRTTTFESLRGRLFGLAYRMLGVRGDAEDLVQEAYVRWHHADLARVQNAEAWLVATTTRLAIDRLRRLKTEREAYKGPWLPEPLLSDTPPPDRALDLASDLSLAFLVLLERLAPEERAAFILHDVFDCSYDDIARILDKSEAACRQTVSRARERVRRDRKRFDASTAEKDALLRRFMAAVEARDEQALMTLFAPDASWTADGGGRAAAAPQPIVGADRIARLLLGLTRAATGWRMKRVSVNGEPGLQVFVDERLAAAMALDVENDRISAVYAVVNPEKLRVTGMALPSSTYQEDRR
jgi:RNA polymerase sigma-70 factor, ECF subfamily